MSFSAALGRRRHALSVALLICVAIVAFAVVAFAQTPPPILSADQSTAAAGESITVHGDQCSFAGSPGTIDVTAFGETIRVNATSDGTWSTSFVIPASTPPGETHVTAECLAVAPQIGGFSYAGLVITVTAPAPTTTLAPPTTSAPTTVRPVPVTVVVTG